VFRWRNCASAHIHLCPYIGASPQAITNRVTSGDTQERVARSPPPANLAIFCNSGFIWACEPPGCSARRAMLACARCWLCRGSAQGADRSYAAAGALMRQRLSVAVGAMSQKPGERALSCRLALCIGSSGAGADPARPSQFAAPIVRSAPQS